MAEDYERLDETKFTQFILNFSGLLLIIRLHWKKETLGLRDNKRPLLAMLTIMKYYTTIK